MKSSNRLARDKAVMFEALARFANLEDAPSDWARFRIMYPDFFPQEINSWMYEGAEEWSKYAADLPHLLPPMLWYRNRLRAVWARTDQHGYNLAVLLGFERDAAAIAEAHRGEMEIETLSRTALIPGRPWVEAVKLHLAQGLPIGKAVIDGVTGQISWEFGSKLQQAIYELMQERWRAKICPECGRFFIATKNAGKFCSVTCTGQAKKERALTYWNETGSKKRAKARKKRAI
jgi:hypothetical protein